jgi:hypothetical protein
MHVYFVILAVAVVAFNVGFICGLAWFAFYNDRPIRPSVRSHGGRWSIKDVETLDKVEP